MSYVRDYLRKVKKIYWDMSAEIEKKYNEMKALDAEYTRVSSSRDYSTEGRQKRLTEISNKRSALKRVLESMREAANNEARKVRDDAEKMFYNYYNASPDDVDLKMTELIRSGVLTDAELIHYGERANQTMKRLIGKELEKRTSPDAQRAGRALQLTTGNPHLQAIDSIMGIGDYAVGGAPMGGLDSVSAIRAKYDGLVDPIISDVKDVKSEFVADRQFFSVEGSAGYDGSI